MITLDARLALIAHMVTPGGRVLDVGTDHALLPSYLVQTGRCEAAYAADIAEMPLANAAETVKRYGLTDRIGLFLSDGLSSVPADVLSRVNTIVIAGMGGELIRDIVLSAGALHGKELILSPMTRAYDLRRGLMTHGYTLTEEHGVTSGRHIYSVMRFSFTGEVCSDELRFYVGSLPESGHEDSKKYLKRLHQRLLRIKTGLSSGGKEAQAGQYSQIIEDINVYANK